MDKGFYPEKSLFHSANVHTRSVMRKALQMLLTAVFAMGLPLTALPQAAQAQDFKAEEPVVVTSCGKSPGALMVKLIAQKAGIACTQNDAITAADLDKTPCKTLIITMGSSGKGLGAAGTDMDGEAKRTKALIEKAHSMGIKVIGSQLEGMSRRTDAADDLSIDSVAPFSDALMVKEEGNADGRFSKIADEKKIPLFSVKQPMEMAPILKTIFGK